MTTKAAFSPEEWKVVQADLSWLTPQPSCRHAVPGSSI